MNDRIVTSEIGHLNMYFKSFGLVMSETAELIARSISTLAKIAVHDE